jgi:hypothetical protein
MAATNDITGAEIKSGIYTSRGRDNHDRIFAKKTAHEWLQTEEFAGIHIHDDDGWRDADGVKMEDRISYKDFCYRLSLSTCSFPEAYFRKITNEI